MSSSTLPFRSRNIDRHDMGLVVLGEGNPPTPVRRDNVVSIQPLLQKHELYAFARHIAGEMGNRTKDAIDLTAAWYQEQIGEDVCSLAQAEELRRMTIERCKYSESGREVRDSVLWNRGTDIGLPKKLRDGRSEGLNAISIAVILLVILAGGSWLFSQQGPEDFQYPGVTSPDQIQAVR